MTNSEAIEKINELFNEKMFWDNSIESYNFELTKNSIISALKENDKLKAEIERLKSELEQSVKLPCKCENCKYADFMGVGAERFYCMEHHRYMVVGGYCSFGKEE